jgi:putative addiction module component (TIGR02574 family)
MMLAKYPDLQKLPRKRKFELAEELWLSGVSDRQPVSAQHKQTIDSRWADYKAGKIKRITREELNRRLKLARG